MIEPRMGGRWYRDLGSGEGHLWGFVQVIKRPEVLEIMGPMFMSYPVAGHVRFTIEESGSGCVLSVSHRAIGMIEDEHRAGADMGWQQMVDRVRDRAEG